MISFSLLRLGLDMLLQIPNMQLDAAAYNCFATASFGNKPSPPSLPECYMFLEVFIRAIVTGVECPT